MYEDFFGFREPPFRITPDPRFLYRNPCVEEAAAALGYGIERRKGFLSLVGEAGTGKTTLLRHVLDSLSGDVRTVLILHPTVGFDEILEYTLGELGVPVEGARKLTLLQRLNEFLLEHTRAGGNVALLIDEAQDLSPTVMEELRLLSNLETGTDKILQIVLAGQPELEAMLAAPGLRQLRQRIALHVRLRPLSADEVAAYVRARLAFAGAPRDDVFAPDAVTRIAAVSQGIPRVINVLCDACLVTAFATGSRQVSAAIVDEAWADYGRLVAPDAAAAPAPSAPPPVAVASHVAAAPPVEPKPVAVVPPPPPAPRPVRMPPPPPAATPAAEPEDDGGGALVLSPRWAVAAIVFMMVGILWYHTWAIRSAAPPAEGVNAPTTVAPPAVAAAPSPLVEPAAAAPHPTGVPTPREARALVHEFVLAYEARDTARLVRLFAPDAVQNDRHGLDTIGADYAQVFARLADVTYTVPSIDVAARGDRIAVAGPFVISFRDKLGDAGERRGRTEWEIARRDGRPRIVALRYAFADPAS